MQCKRWEQISKSFNFPENITFGDFTELDAEVCRQQTDDEIISQSISSPPSDNEEELNVPKASQRVTAF